jgi:hypothetical protein
MLLYDMVLYVVIYTILKSNKHISICYLHVPSFTKSASITLLFIGRPKCVHLYHQSISPFTNGI